MIGASRQLLDLGARRLGFFSGTFDPPHDGHLRLMERVLGGRHVDCVVVCPHNHNPRKQANRVDMIHRVAMLERLLEHSQEAARLFLCDPLFLHGLQNKAFHLISCEPRLHGREPWLVRGRDALRPGYCPVLAKLPHVVVPRDGAGNAGLQDILSAGYVVTTPIADNSSTNVRAILAAGGFHPVNTIDQYIRTEGLYRPAPFSASG